VLSGLLHLMRTDGAPGHTTRHIAAAGSGGSHESDWFPGSPHNNRGHKGLSKHLGLVADVAALLHGLGHGVAVEEAASAAVAADLKTHLAHLSQQWV
jgi:hypothetical protein